MASALLRSALAPLFRPITARRPDTAFRRPLLAPVLIPSSVSPSPLRKTFATTIPRQATLMQVLRGCRKQRRARHKVSPALAEANAPMLKGVCIKVGVTKPKKPNSGERKTARIRLSTGRQVTAFIPGEGHNIQQHSVVLVKGGRLQDCPGVRYKCVRGALDLGGVVNRRTSRSKYGSKKPRKATVD